MIQIRKRSDGTFHVQVPTADFDYFQSATGITPEENRSYGWSFDVKAVGDEALITGNIEANAHLPSLAGTGRKYAPVFVSRLDGKDSFYILFGSGGLYAMKIINSFDDESALHENYTLTTDDDKIQRVKELIDEAQDLLLALIGGDSYGC